MKSELNLTLDLAILGINFNFQVFLRDARATFVVKYYKRNSLLQQALKYKKDKLLLLLRKSL